VAPALSTEALFRAAVLEAGFAAFEPHEVHHSLVIQNYEDLVSFTASNPVTNDLLKATHKTIEDYGQAMRQAAQEMHPNLPIELPFVSILGVCRK
jgi:hypothetical protein